MEWNRKRQQVELGKPLENMAYVALKPSEVYMYDFGGCDPDVVWVSVV